ncbi:MAG TPA: biotin carboxylase N-terminal domain-containing protein [Thermoanaerobaculia bacterium]|nr:biotin carboxylase N-terminal domain-containing protein [Thermoanaerobaculia bacterium]
MSGRRIARLLVANRGEIAVRVIRACRALGISPVAVYSTADANARHVAMADDAVGIGEAPARESYLRADKILDAARATACDAVHPGFGFLSENAAFARAVKEAGLVWVGPPPAAIEAMGLKIESRERMKAAGVPVVPGTHDVEDDAAVTAVGLPAVVKASAGGGGKGMRVVRDRAGLADALAACRREAGAAFGDATVYLERYLEKPRHIEVQVFGDETGRVVAMGERECSLQRRHQKVIEESPSPAVLPDLRRRLSEAAIAAAKAVGYVNAGTVEFLLAPDGSFYFLEMNTRLQVEHPVTEEAFGLDLVTLQLRVAQGEPLPAALPEQPIAHAIEARLYAEDADAGFLPQTGKVLVYDEPRGPGIRVDSGIAAGDEVSVHYDPMLAKIIARGATREEARRRLVAALAETVVLGVTTNLSYLRRVLETPEVVRGEIDTGFLERHAIAPAPAPPAEVFEAAAWAFASQAEGSASDHDSAPRFPDPFASPFRALA